MYSVSQDQNATTQDNTNQTQSSDEYKKMVDQLTELNKTLNGMVNDVFSPKKPEKSTQDFSDYTDKGIDINLSKDANLSPQDAFQNQRDAEQTLNNHEKAASQANQSMDMGEEVMSVVEENPELLAML